MKLSVEIAVFLVFLALGSFQAHAKPNQKRDENLELKSVHVASRS
jgi:hypothetical protein